MKDPLNDIKLASEFIQINNNVKNGNNKNKNGVINNDKLLIINNFKQDQRELNNSSENFIISLIEEMQNFSKIELPIKENDYISPRKMENIELEEFRKITGQFEKDSMIELKKEIDNNNLSGNNLFLISTLENLIKKKYIAKNKNIESVINNFNIYEKIIFKLRGTKVDNDSLYRCIMLYYIENIIFEKNIQTFRNLFYDIYTYSKEEYFIELISKNKINFEHVYLILFLIYYGMHLKDPNDAVIKPYTILIKSINHINDFDLGIILYLKYLLYKYIQNNEEKLYSKDISIKIYKLLPKNYNKDGKYLYKEFYENELIPFNKEPQKIVIYMLPFALGKTLKIYSFDFENDLNILKELYFNSNVNSNDKENTESYPICLFFVNSHYDILYPKNYYEQYKEYLFVFLDDNSKEYENNQSNNSEVGFIDNKSNDKEKSEENPNKILPSDISKLSGFDKEEKYNCPLCNIEINKDFCCDKCNTDILKLWLASSYSNFIKYNIGNLIKNGKMEKFTQFIEKYPVVNYKNKLKKNFEEGYQFLSEKFDFKQHILSLKNSLCLGCFKYFSVLENSFIYKLPCKCMFCSNKCLKKFIDAIPFNKMSSFTCACGEEYDIIKLKYFASFLYSLNFNNPKNEIFKYIYNKIKNKCAKCNCDINIENNKINIITVYDNEINSIFDISNFPHLICDNCWKNIENDNSKFICEICNSIHLIIEKNYNKNKNLDDNCSIC